MSVQVAQGVRSRKGRRRLGEFGKTIFELEAEAAKVEWEAIFRDDKENVAQVPETSVQGGPHPTGCSIFLNSSHPLSHITPQRHAQRPAKH